MDKRKENEEVKNPLLSDDDSYVFVPSEVIQALDSILNKLEEARQEIVKVKGEN